MIILLMTDNTTKLIWSIMDSSSSKREEPKKVFGGCEGPDSEYIKLISSDNHEFIIKREHAMTSNTIRAMLSGPGNI